MYEGKEERKGIKRGRNDLFLCPSYMEAKLSQGRHIASYLQRCEGNISTCLYILSVHNLHVAWNET